MNGVIKSSVVIAFVMSSAASGELSGGLAGGAASYETSSFCGNESTYDACKNCVINSIGTANNVDEVLSSLCKQKNKKK